MVGAPFVFVAVLEEEVLQKWVESFLRGDEEGVEFIAKWCTDRALQVCARCGGLLAHCISRPEKRGARSLRIWPRADRAAAPRKCRRCRCVSCTSRSGSGLHLARAWMIGFCSSRRCPTSRCVNCLTIKRCGAVARSKRETDFHVLACWCSVMTAQNQNRGTN
jgi:hypothetical protein